MTVAQAIGSSDYRAEIPFRVSGFEDLNWHPYAVLPVSWVEHHKKRVLCVSRTDVTVMLRLPKAGYTSR